MSNYSSFIKWKLFHHVTRFSKLSFMSFESFPELLVSLVEDQYAIQND